jgi:hypothetical protein
MTAVACVIHERVPAALSPCPLPHWGRGQGEGEGFADDSGSGWSPSR